MNLRRYVLILVGIQLFSSCETIKEKLGTPDAKDFKPCYQWFIELITPANLTNQERVVLTLLTLIVLGSSMALINSSRLLNFFKEPSFKSDFLKRILLGPNFLKFSFKDIKHPGWAVGIWVFIRSIYICILLILTFVAIFYLAVILPYIIVIIIIIIIIIIILILGAINGE
jgi:hypothetical protein